PSNYSKYHLFFFIITTITENQALSLHDALPILHDRDLAGRAAERQRRDPQPDPQRPAEGNPVRRIAPGSCGNEKFGHAGRSITIDRKSTRLNSSHVAISYAVFCLKKKKNRRLRK